MTSRRFVAARLARLLLPGAALACAALAAPAADGSGEPADPRPASAASAAPASPPAPSPITDPMERLRQRLAERLAGGGSGGLAGRVEVHSGAAVPVAAKASAKASLKASTQSPAKPPAAAPAPRRGAASKAPAGDAAHPAAPHWSYAGPGGPAAWGELRPEYALCASGERQSPIDIRDGLAVDLEPVRFAYQPSRFGVVDNGHTVQVNVAPGNSIEVAGRRYELVQFHFHRPSEERIDGRQFEMSVHLVHRDAEGRLAVVAVLLQKGPAQPVVQVVWNNLPLEKNEEAVARTLLDPGGLLPGDRRYYTYMGSLTTPPCSEDVRWVVMRAPVTAAAEQLDLFARIYPMNARPLQTAAGRRILQSN